MNSLIKKIIITAMFITIILTGITTVNAATTTISLSSNDKIVAGGTITININVSSPVYGISTKLAYDKDAFEKFMFVLEDMTKAIDNLAVYKNSNPEFVMDEGKIFSILSDAMEALQSDDKVLMADILQYDFIEYISDLVENME